MKPLIALVLILFSSIAFADSFRLDQDGQEYLCSPTTPNDPDGALSCSIKAYRRGPFSIEQAIELCSGDATVANAECAIKAYRTYSKEEAIQLCKALR